jgi:hypothetical protein
MVLMVDWSLSSSPLSVGVTDVWTLGEDSSSVPEEEVRVVNQRLSVDSMVVHDNGSSVLKTSS